MSDPIAQAFAHLPHPEPAADFDRRVLARLAPARAAHMLAARAVMMAYWLTALAASLLATLH